MSKKHKKWEKDEHRPDANESPANHSEVEANMIYTVKIQPNPDDETRYAEQNTYQRQQIQATKLANIISGIAAGIAGVTLVSLIIYACITFGQLKEARVSNGINRDALVSVQRAFISFNRVKEERSLNSAGGHLWRITPIVENSGTTTAVPVINRVHAQRLPKEPEEDLFKGSDTRFPPTSIGPKAIQGLSAIEETESFVMGKELGDLSQPAPEFVNATLYVWGWVAYRDIFKTPHVTEFCLRMNSADIGKNPPVVQPNMNNCENHNCTDNYCPDFQAIEALIPTSN